MKAYLTGATGCVGRNILNELLQDGWEVIVAHRKTSNLKKLDGLKVTLREVNLHCERSVLSSMDSNVDAIFHVAANTSDWSLEEDEQYKDNVIATRNLVHAALEKSVKRFIFTSTGATDPYQDYDEKKANTIYNQYVRSKRLSELEVEKGIKKGLDAVILCPAIVIGPYDYNNYSEIFNLLKERKLSFIFPSKIVFCHATDVGKAHVTAYEKGRNNSRYPLGGPFMSWYDFAHKAAQVLDVPGPKGEAPIWILKPLSYILLWLSFLTHRKPLFTPQLVSLLTSCHEDNKSDDGLTRDELRYKHTHVEEMIRDYLDWSKAEPVYKQEQIHDVENKSKKSKKMNQLETSCLSKFKAS